MGVNYRRQNLYDASSCIILVYISLEELVSCRKTAKCSWSRQRLIRKKKKAPNNLDVEIGRILKYLC